jgi:hypothetical protein
MHLQPLTQTFRAIAEFVHQYVSVVGTPEAARVWGAICKVVNTQQRDPVTNQVTNDERKIIADLARGASLLPVDASYQIQVTDDHIARSLPSMPVLGTLALFESWAILDKDVQEACREHVQTILMHAKNEASLHSEEESSSSMDDIFKNPNVLGNMLNPESLQQIGSLIQTPQFQQSIQQMIGNLAPAISGIVGAVNSAMHQPQQQQSQQPQAPTQQRFY